MHMYADHADYDARVRHVPVQSILIHLPVEGFVHVVYLMNDFSLLSDEIQCTGVNRCGMSALRCVHTLHPSIAACATHMRITHMYIWNTSHLDMCTRREVSAYDT
jgi:hypothetical protein